MLPQRSDIETSAQGFKRLIWCTNREQNPHCNFSLFSHTVPPFDPGAVADGKGAGPSFLFFISFCCNVCATGTSKEGERRWGHNEKGGRQGHQRVREGTRWGSVAGITGGRGWNLTQQRWRAPPLHSSFIHLFQWECEKETAFFIAFLIKYFLLLPLCDTIPYDKSFVVSMGSGLRQCSTWPLRRKLPGKKVLWEKWPVANTNGQWEASGAELVLVEWHQTHVHNKRKLKPENDGLSKIRPQPQ